MSKFNTYYRWCGGKNSNFVDIPTTTGQYDVAITSYSVTINPDEQFNIGYMVVTNPFDPLYTVKIPIRLSQTGVFDRSVYLMTLHKDYVKDQIISFEYNRLLSDETKVDSEIIKQLTLLYEFKQLEVPFVYKINDLIKLHIPKNTYCKLVFCRNIEIIHEAKEEESTYLLHKDTELEYPITDPIFTINLHINNDWTEKIPLWYTKDADGQHRMHNIMYTTIEPQLIKNIKISITDVTDVELDTSGDCFLHFRPN